VRLALVADALGAVKKSSAPAATPTPPTMKPTVERVATE
jgi:hypothetical protein